MLGYDMAVICPTVTTLTPQHYRESIERVADFAERIHIDFADGVFAPTKLVPIEDAWWPIGPVIDFHIMYKNPLEHIEAVVEQQPSLVIIHAESANVKEFLRELDGLGIHRGLALLKDTPAEAVKPFLDQIEHVLVFSGDLGHYGGTVDLRLLDKVEKLISFKPTLEIGWDGGINTETALKLTSGGVNVLNVGGFIQKASDPEAAYDTLVSSIS
jgi:ribulose-phosphate 3-epimerase